MKAIRIHEKGGPEVLIYEDAPRPRLMPGDALVRVYASAITKDELTWDPTYQTANGEPRTPSIPGHEFSGVVEELALYEGRQRWRRSIRPRFVLS